MQSPLKSLHSSASRPQCWSEDEAKRAPNPGPGLIMAREPLENNLGLRKRQLLDHMWT